jgi:hypothetical protein
MSSGFYNKIKILTQRRKGRKEEYFAKTREWIGVYPGDTAKAKRLSSYRKGAKDAKKDILERQEN